MYCFGILIIRSRINCGLYLGPPILGSYHLGFRVWSLGYKSIGPLGPRVEVKIFMEILGSRVKPYKLKTLNF